MNESEKWKVKVKSLSRVRLSDPIDCSPPGSSVHGIFPGKSTGVGCMPSNSVILCNISSLLHPEKLVVRQVRCFFFFFLVLEGFCFDKTSLKTCQLNCKNLLWIETWHLHLQSQSSFFFFFNTKFGLNLFLLVSVKIKFRSFMSSLIFCVPTMWGKQILISKKRQTASLRLKILPWVCACVCGRTYLNIQYTHSRITRTWTLSHFR